MFVIFFLSIKLFCCILGYADIISITHQHVKRSSTLQRLTQYQ